MSYSVGDRARIIESNSSFLRGGQECEVIGVWHDGSRPHLLLLRFLDGHEQYYHESWLRPCLPPDPAWDEYDQSEDP